MRVAPIGFVTCSDCRYWLPIDEEHKTGECRRHCPGPGNVSPAITFDDYGCGDGSLSNSVLEQKMDSYERREKS